MNISRKAVRLTKLNHAISMLLLLVSFSCSAQKKYADNSALDILKSEISRHSSLYDRDKVYLSFTSNNYLINFIKENEIGANNDNINLLKLIKPEEVQLIFNKTEVLHLVESLQNSTLKLNINSYHQNLIVYSKDTLNTIDEFEKKRIYLSNPATTSDNKYGLISYSYGKKNSMQGGINLYHNINNEWKFYRSIEIWVE